MTQTFSPEVIAALAELRTYAGKYPSMGLSERINTLDNAGVFAALDEQTDYASAVDVLAEAAVATCLCGGSFDGRRGGIGCSEQEPDPAEWGDTTSADVARRQGLDEPLYGAAADRVRDELEAERIRMRQADRT